MKKLIIIALLVALFCVGSVAEAKSIISDKQREKFMKIDLDRLIEYRDAINDIIVERGGEAKTNSSANQIEGEPFSEGVYEVGKTIKPGTYRFDITDMNFGAMVYVYESMETYEESNSKEWYIPTGDSASYTITLEEGNVFKIVIAPGGHGNITISNAKASWMP